MGTRQLTNLRERIWASPRYRWWALAVLLLGFFSTGFSITILTAVLPTIAREFGVGTSTIAWVVTGPMLMFGILMPTMGKLADLHGRKIVYVLGWGLSMALTGLAALSWSAGALIALRFLAAAAGATTGPVAMALILSVFPPAERVKAMGWWSFMGAGAPVIGLVAGGPLIDLFGWRWIFGIHPLLAFPGIVLAALVLRPDRPDERPRFDVWGSVLLGLTMGAFLFGLNRGGADVGWARPDVILPLVFTPIGAALFLAVERRQPEPLLRLGYFRRRNVTVPLTLMLISHIPYMGTFFLAPFLFQGVLGYDNSATAFALVPRPLANSLASAAAGYIAFKLGERSTSFGGMCVLVGGLLVFAAIGADSSWLHVVVAMTLTGLGMGLSLPGLTSSVANAVEERDFGAISATQTMVMMVGMVLGMQGLQTVHAVRARAVGEVAAFQETFLFGAGFAVVGVLLALAVRSMHRTYPTPPTESPETPSVPEPVREQATGGGSSADEG